MKSKDGKKVDSVVEGEGSYTAARRYREGLERSVREGRSDELAEKAKEALDGPEGIELREAEDRAKSPRVNVPAPGVASGARQPVPRGSKGAGRRI
jgi:hypothetical protein